MYSFTSLGRRERSARKARRHAWQPGRTATIILAALSPLAALLPATVLGADTAFAAPSAGYTATLVPVGSGNPQAVAVDPVTNTVYVGETGGHLVVMDGSSHAIKATLPLAAISIAVDPVTDTVYATDGTGEIAVIAGATNSVTATIPVATPTQTGALAVDSATNTIYAADGSLGVAVIDGSTNTVTKTVSSGGFATEVAVDEATDVVWVVNSVREPVVAISGASGSIIHSLSVATAPYHIAVNPVTDTVYVGSTSSVNGLTVIDGATGTITATVPIGGTATGQIAVDPSADVVFARGFTTSGSGMVVIDGATNTIADVLRIGAVAAAVDATTGTVYETSSETTTSTGLLPGVWVITPSASNAISPILIGPTTAVAAVGVPIYFSFTVIGLPIPTFSETGALPVGVTLNPVNGQLSGIPLVDSVGRYSIQVTATNNAGRATQAVTLTVTGPAVAALATSGVPYAQAPQLGSGWHSLGGKVSATPAVAAAPNVNGNTPASPLFLAPGTNHLLYIRGLTGAWQRVGPSDPSCLSVAAVLTASSTLNVACEGLNHALYYGSASVPSSGLPVFTKAWKGLGGALAAGPAVAPVGGVLTFFIRGTNGRIYIRTTTTGYRQQTWTCLGQPAAAFDVAAQATLFACEGANHGIYEGPVTSTGLAANYRIPGTVAAGPAIAAASQAPYVLLVGTNHVVYQGAYLATPYTKLIGITVIGVEAAALN